MISADVPEKAMIKAAITSQLASLVRTINPELLYQLANSIFINSQALLSFDRQTPSLVLEFILAAFFILLKFIEQKEPQAFFSPICRASHSYLRIRY